MSGEIVVGACYRDRDDPKSEVVRVTRVSGGLVTWESLPPLVGGATVSEERWRTFNAVRVPDPTPAVIDDAELLAGEMTLRQVEAWRVRRGIDDLSLLYATRTRLWHAHAERDGTVIGHGTSSDPQDAITAMMARVGP